MDLNQSMLKRSHVGAPDLAQSVGASSALASSAGVSNAGVSAADGGGEDGNSRKKQTTEYDVAGKGRY